MGRMSDNAFGGDLFTPPTESTAPLLSRTTKQLARQQNPSTSYQAADGIIHKLRPLQLKVLEVLKAAGPSGLADFEIEERCGDHGSTYRTRRAELVEVGLVRDSGRVANLKGTNRIVWVITELVK